MVFCSCLNVFSPWGLTLVTFQLVFNSWSCQVDYFGKRITTCFLVIYSKPIKLLISIVLKSWTAVPYCSNVICTTMNWTESGVGQCLQKQLQHSSGTMSEAYHGRVWLPWPVHHHQKNWQQPVQTTLKDKPVCLLLVFSAVICSREKIY